MGIQTRRPISRDCTSFALHTRRNVVAHGTHTMQYNETINDLLGKGEFDKKKHDIKHEKLHGSIPSTRVTDVTVHPLSTPHQVTTLLQLANSRRTVAATLMNSRSSRSHSVFTLRVSGYNEQTGTRCEGCLNLVDLAGSERLSASGAAGDKERLKETQSINKSLSALGDVIAALGESGRGEKESRGAGEKHVPYRNSKVSLFWEVLLRLLCILPSSCVLSSPVSCGFCTIGCCPRSFGFEFHFFFIL